MKPHAGFLIEAALFIAFLSGCQRPSFPPIAKEPIPAPSVTTVVVEKGSNLRTIAAAAYGHARFSGFVARLNNISDPDQVVAGTTLNTPSLSVAFRDLGLDPSYQPAMNALAKACADYYSALPAYMKVREASGVSSRTVEIPSNIQSRFLASAELIDRANLLLGAVKPPDSVPRQSIGQFHQASTLIRSLAAGSTDRDGLDLDMVGQRFGLGFTDAIIWTQEHYH